MKTENKDSDGNGLGIILQARMGSTRLPGKIFKQIGSKTLLDHIFFRLKSLRHRVAIVLATSHLSKDDEVERYCRENGICCFRGSEENVLERYYFCAKEYGFKNIVRLTADNPFVDVEELDNLIDLHYHNNADYSSSYQSLPVGVGAEIFTFAALEQSYSNGKALHHLEHVDEYILENARKFHIDTLKVDGVKNRPKIRLTIDTEADYRAACYIVENALQEYVTTQDAIRLVNDFNKQHL